MRATRSKYHYMIRKLKRSRDLHIRGAMGRALLSHDNRDYWNEIKKIRGKGRSNATVINGCTQSKDIANLFADKYKLLYNSVVSDDSELQLMARAISEDIQSTCKNSCPFSHTITASDVKSAVKKLRFGKTGGASTMSDCYIHGTDLLYYYISILFNAMLIHGVLHDEFRMSILIPIPKGSRVDKRNSDNYRAVALSSILGKILDHIILNTQRESLQTSDLQFGYKAKLSTMMCSTLVIETIQYFTALNAPLYALFIDASKAFDRLCHIQLFKVLSVCNMCPLVRRLLYNLYRDQYIRVRWDDSLSDVFCMKNGVKQGAVLSPGLFTLYIDGLLKQLQQSRVGCHVGNIYAGAFGYADDIVLLAPSLSALQFMITMCESYAQDYHIMFNPKKSKLMCFNVKHTDIQIQLCGQTINIVDNETYLGNYIGANIWDRAMTRSVGSFTQKSNHVIAEFSMLDSYSVCKLHSIYCMSLYGSELWNYNGSYIQDIYVAWRKVMRKLFRLPPRAHNYIVCNITECISIKLHRRLTRFIYSMLNSENETVRAMTEFLLTVEASTLAENYRYLMYQYNIPVNYWHGSMTDLLKCIKCKTELSSSEISNISAITELILIRDNIMSSPIMHREAAALIDVLCID